MVRICLCFWPFVLIPPPRSSYTSSFSFRRLLTPSPINCSRCHAPPSRDPVAPTRRGSAERRAAESPASRQARLASDKAATRRRHQAQNMESSITAKRRNSEKERERRAAESLASRRQAIGLLSSRLQLGDAVRHWSPASLPSDSEHRINCARPT